MKILTFSAPPVNENEIFRYMRSARNDEANSLLNECLKEAEAALTYNVAFEIFPVKFFAESADNGLIDLFFTKTHSKDLFKNLKNYGEFVLFAASVGVGIDRLIARYSVISPSKALCFQAIGAERVEALCDSFCEMIKTEFETVAPRFSPGYGDLDLSLQRDIFNALPLGRIGISLNDSLLMSPSKSVTALIGVKRK